MAKKKKGTKTSSFGTGGRISHDSSSFYNSKLYSELNDPATANSQQPIANNQQPTANDQQPTANSQQPTANDQQPTANSQQPIANNLPENQILLSSAEDMSVLPNDCVHLMVTSPPYNVSKDYDEDLSLREYLSLLENVFRETYRVLVPGGRACINIANLGRRPYLSLTSHITHLMCGIGFLMRGEIVWDKGASSSGSTAWGSWMSASNPTLRDVHEYILVFSKGDYKRTLSKEEKAFKENTITKEQFLDWTKSIWRFSAESARRIGHPAPFPEDLPYRLIQLFSFSGDIVLDPFMGSGTTALSAMMSGRKFIGYETVEEYRKLALRRLANLELF